MVGKQAMTMPSVSSTCAVIGSPISHSLSPRLHRAFYACLGQPLRSFDALDVSADSFPAFWASLDIGQYAGLSVTMPLKSLAAAAADHVHGAAAEIMVANTIVFDGERSHAHNTDVSGLSQIIRSSGISVKRGIVIGSGDTAASALVALRESGASEVWLIARNFQAITEMQERVRGINVIAVSLADAVAADLPDVDVWVSTVPSSAASEVASLLPMSSHCDLFVDLAYSPQASPLMHAMRPRATTMVDGLECLIQQGVDQVMLHLGLFRSEQDFMLQTSASERLAETTMPATDVDSTRALLVEVGRRALATHTSV